MKNVRKPARFLTVLETIGMPGTQVSRATFSIRRSGTSHSAATKA